MGAVWDCRICGEQHRELEDADNCCSNLPHKAVEMIRDKERRIDELEAALRDVFEEWAGSEGFIPETAPEGYLLQLVKKMALIALAALGETK